MADNVTAATSGHRLPYLDGLRGTAAAWVFLHHAAILNAIQYPVLKEGLSAVDLFMLLSGFLMTFHYLEREAREPWTDPGTWFRFWVRRFFRIAPLYYVLLAVAMLAGNWIGDWRDVIASVHPDTATAVSRYTDQSALNWLTHLSFAFGLSPSYSFRTALPDWSIGLEMQFYLVFPFLMLVWRAVGPFITVLAALLFCAVTGLVLKGYFDAFPMPSMLALKLHVFAAGMLLAAALKSSDRITTLGLVALAMVLPLLSYLIHIENIASSRIQIALVLIFAALVFHENLARLPVLKPVVGAVIRFLDSRPMRHLGDTSYSVYLVHLLILIPLVGLLSSFPAYGHLPNFAKMGLSIVLSAPPVYLLAWGLHHAVELRGIALGKLALSRRTARPQVAEAGD